MGRFCSGLVVVAGLGAAGEPVGLTCQSFASLSLDPLAFLFCPARSSTSWPQIKPSGQIAVSILAETQQGVSDIFARSGADKFAKVEWTHSRAGLPVLADAIACFDATIRTVFDGGDHEIVVCDVVDFDFGAGERPLVYFDGSYERLESPRVHNA